MPRETRPASGFSLVELLVALAFTGILMAGLAMVFKSSITTFYASSENLSSVRRNRASLDVLYEDLNTMGLYLEDLQAQPAGLSASNPPFYILPQQKIDSPSPNGPTLADQIFFYVDQPFPFLAKITNIAGTQNSGSVVAPGKAINDNVMVATGAAVSSYDPTITVDCGSQIYANQVYYAFNTQKLPIAYVLQDYYQNNYVASMTAPTGSTLTLTPGASADIATTGLGSPGLPPKNAHIPNASVTFFVPKQMIRYSVQMLQLDPQDPKGTPCLVRDQGTYSPSGFVPNPDLQQVITENVQDFRVYLSAAPGFLVNQNAATAWVPSTTPPANQSLDDAWTSGILGALNTQLGTVGRAGQTSVGNSLTWFRDIPVAVRVDVTTRTATQRSEFSSTPQSTAAYKDFTRTVVMVPRHFGLPLTQ